ncbi:MAG TPA: prepilin-type N-terminal cleavage/methylation domain-containing protein [Hyalangium sp.]|jgi:prepilin-type N-terminal cleavage/methylation domain-containing protein|nr:prepilin-type N-terminal cleavage/methylation domain-containing protein [Hyalangium sp.]
MRGYTLMELMVTVALLAIMSAMTAVGLGPLHMRYRVRKAVDVTAQLLVRTRLRAIETSRCHQVEILADGIPVSAGSPGDALRVSRRRDADCESRPDPLALVEVERVTLPERMQVRLKGSEVLVFRPTGRTGDNAPRRFLVGREGELRGVVAAPNGPVCALEREEEDCP